MKGIEEGPLSAASSKVVICSFQQIITQGHGLFNKSIFQSKSVISLATYSKAKESLPSPRCTWKRILEQGTVLLSSPVNHPAIGILSVATWSLGVHMPGYKGHNVARVNSHQLIQGFLTDLPGQPHTLATRRKFVILPESTS